MTASKGLSKSRLLGALQCERRLWLSTFRPDVAVEDQNAARVLALGNDVGDLARRIYGSGRLIANDLEEALRETREELARSGDHTLFEATFRSGGVLIRADVLQRRKGHLHLIEVKASSSVRDYQVLDASIQAWVMREAGYPPRTVSLAHIDTGFRYEGGDAFAGIFKEVDVTDVVTRTIADVPKWIRAAGVTLAGPEPMRDIGPHCSCPFDCPFLSHCGGPAIDYPVTMLPNGGSRTWKLRSEGFRDLRDVPEDRLKSERQRKVWRVSRSGAAELQNDLRVRLAGLPFPRYYVDFETIALAIPHWPGTSPYEKVPYQWSLHIERKPGALEHADFLAQGRELPCGEFLVSLLTAVGQVGPIITFGHFEKTILTDLANKYPSRAESIRRVIERIVDLLPLVRAGYYHPAMKGSWSIKALLPTVCPDISYADLGDVRNGEDAEAAFAESLLPTCPPERREQLRSALSDYCKLDTLAMTLVVSRLGTPQGA